MAFLWSGLLSMSLWYYAVLGMTKGNQVDMQPVCQGAKHWPFQCMQKTLKTSAKIRAGSLRSQGRSGGKKRRSKSSSSYATLVQTHLLSLSSVLKEVPFFLCREHFLLLRASGTAGSLLQLTKPCLSPPGGGCQSASSPCVGQKIELPPYFALCSFHGETNAR